ncbi:MAG: hypothetical protein QNK37_16860 [Acidobacteriota bacterium]|nr:hypothetical protein [Acidobacteriota bacterium]
MRNRFKLGDRIFQVDLLDKHPPKVHITEKEAGRETKLQGKLRPGHGALFVDDRYLPYFVTETPTAVWVTLDGVTRVFEKCKNREQAEEGHGGFISPMPGKVIKVSTKPGARVEKGAVLVIMEAMKMEHRIEAPVAGTVTALHCNEGQVVDQGFALLEFNPD